jgi:hypothetical protein
VHVVIGVDLNVPVPPKMMPFTFGDNPFYAVSQQSFSAQYQMLSCHLTLSGYFFPHGNVSDYNWPFC